MGTLTWYPRLAVVTLLVPLLFGNFSWYDDAFSNVRNPLLILAAVTIVLLVVSPPFRKSARGLFTEPDTFFSAETERRVQRFLMVYFLLFFSNCALMNYMGFAVNAIDFSIWDHMMVNTARGKFMMSVGGELNHFGVHSTPILFLLYPLHRLFETPLFFVLVHAVILWSAAIPLWILLKERVGSGWQRCAILFAFFNFTSVARVLDYNFYVEVFYVPLFLWLFVCLEKRRWGLFALVAALLLSVKEDAAVYLCGVAVALPFYPLRGGGRRELFRAAAVLALASLAVFFLNVKWVIPRNAGHAYRLAGAVSGYGSTVGESLRAALVRWRVLLYDLVTGKWVTLTAGFLFTPLLIPFFVIAAFPFALVHAMALNPEMKALAYYYSAPYIPLLFVGFLLFLSRNLRPKLRSSAVLFMCLSLSLVGREYLMFRRINPDWKFLSALRLRLDPDRSICAEGSIVPYIGYPTELKLLSPECLRRKMDYYVLNEHLAPWPWTFAQIGQMERALESDPQYRKETIGRFQLFTKQVKTSSR